MVERLDFGLDEILDDLERSQQRLDLSLPSPEKVRLTFKKRLSEKNPRACLLLGPRGVGKSTLMLLAARTKKALYLSADSPRIASSSLWELGKAAFARGYESVLFDEVHLARNWSRDLKALYDEFPDREIWASDSSQLSLQKGLADLSRRFLRIRIPLLSFREYLHLKTGIELEPFDPLDSAHINRRCQAVLQKVPVSKHFSSYLDAGMRPIFQEGHYPERMLQILEKTLFSDLPFLIPQLHENHFRLMNAIMGHLAMSPVPTLNIDSLGREWAIGKEKLYRLLSAMDQIELLHIIRKASDRKVLSKGAKILFRDPSFYAALGSAHRGNQREAFVASQFASTGQTPFASKNEEDCDFVVNGVKLEVGGPSKPKKKSDIVLRDQTDLPTRNGKEVPLWAAGMMY